MPEPSSSSHRLDLEKITAFLLVTLALLHIGLYAERMAVTSLWIDEIGMIQDQVREGPVACLTEYNRARNHVLLSLICSVLPGRDSTDSLVQRLPVYFATALLIGAVLAYFGRRRQWLEAGLVLFLWGMVSLNPLWAFQLRGYSLLYLFAFLSAAAVLEYHRTQRLRAYYALCAFTILGAWTVPSYLAFGGLLMILQLWDRRFLKEKILAGIATGFLSALFYVGLLDELIETFTTYEETFESFYQGPGALLATLQSYVWPLPTAIVVILAVLLPFYPWLLRQNGKPQTLGAWTLIAAVAGFLLLNMLLELAPLRTTAFVSVPVAVVVAIISGHLIRQIRERKFVNPILGTVLLGSIGIFLFQLNTFRVIPLENWKDTARLTRLMYPPGTTVDISEGARVLDFYLDPRVYDLTREPVAADYPAYRNGLMPVVYSPYSPNAVKRWWAEDRGKWEAFGTILPGAARPILVHMRPTPDHPKLRLETQSSPPADATLLFHLPSDLPIWSLNLFFEAEDGQTPPIVSTVSRHDGMQLHRVPEERLFISRDLLVVNLAGMEARQIQITVDASSLSRKKSFWIIPQTDN